MRDVEDGTGGSGDRAACCADWRWGTGVDQQRLREGARSLVLGATLRGWVALHGLVCGRKVERRHRGVYMGFMNDTGVAAERWDADEPGANDGALPLTQRW